MKLAIKIGLGLLLFLVGTTVSTGLLNPAKAYAASPGCYEHQAGSTEYREVECTESEGAVGQCYTRIIVPRNAQPFEEINCDLITNVVTSESGGTGQTTSEELNESCESGGPLSWIGCPIIVGIDEALGSIQANVVEILVIEPEKYENNNVKAAWVIFRNIASALLVIVMLVMVISTALGFSFVDAYTVKKMLPRLVAAAILILLSWPLMSFAINLVNAVGEGIFGLMLAPFGGQEATDLPSLVMNSEGGQGLFNTIVTVGLVGGGIALGFFGLLSLAFTVFLTVLVGFAVLVLRNLVIIATLIFAPIALVAWVTPGTNKLWNLWWDSFSKALLMFPFIMILFAGGRILAWITINTSTSDDGVNLGPDWLQTDHSGTMFQLIVVVLAYAIPFFIIPFTLRFAGGLVATLGGFANDRSRGIFDRQQKFREGRRAKNWEDMRDGNRFKGAGRLSKTASSGLGVVSNLDKAGFNPTKMRSRINDAMQTSDFTSAMENLEKNEHFLQNKGNEDFLQAGIANGDWVRSKDGSIYMVNGKGVRRDGSEAAVRAHLASRGYDKEIEDGGLGAAGLSQQVASIRAMQRGMSQEAYNIAAAVGTAGTGTGYKGGAGEMDAEINSVAGNNRALASNMLNAARGAAERAGRLDLVGGGFATRLGMMTENYVGLQRAGADEAQRRAVISKTSHDVASETYRTKDARNIFAGKASTIENQIVPIAMEEVHAAVVQGNSSSITEEFAKVAGYYDMLSSTSPEKAKIWGDKVMARTLDVASLTPEMRDKLDGAINTRDKDGNITSSLEHVTLQQATEALRGDQRFLELRREYASDIRKRGGAEPPEAPQV